MKKSSGIFLLLFWGACYTVSIAQNPVDSTQQLREIAIQGYLSRQPLLQTPASVGLLNREQLQRFSEQSLLPAFNLLPGVRMEERSPGSYRLSIRGSLLRSPFGIRNIKIYLDGFPLTDAGGNTYLNLIDRTNWTFDRFNSQVGRQEIKKSIEAIYDHTYESNGPTGDHGTEVSIVFGVGLSYSMAKNIKLGLEYKTMGFSGLEYVDGLNIEIFGNKESVSADYYQFTVEYFFR